MTGKTLIIADPMLATGSSLVMTYNALVEKAGMPKFTHVATVIGSEEGVEYAKKHLSANNCKIWCGSLDAEMTVKSYIVPGMGDAGDPGLRRKTLRKHGHYPFDASRHLLILAGHPGESVSTGGSATTTALKMQ